MKIKFVIEKSQRRELAAFKRMHDRVRDGKVPSIEWSRTNVGFLEFFACVGPIPNSLQKPSIGRIDHKKGYQHNNVQWEEHAVNSVKRKGTRHEGQTATHIEFHKDRPRLPKTELRKLKIENLKKYWSDPEHRHERSKETKQLWEQGIFDNRATSEWRHKQSISHIGIKRSTEAIAKTAAALKGRTRPEDVKFKISQSQRQRWLKRKVLCA